MSSPKFEIFLHFQIFHKNLRSLRSEVAHQENAYSNIIYLFVIYLFVYLFIYLFSLWKTAFKKFKVVWSTSADHITSL